MTSKVWWLGWALVLLVGVSFHFGPGQRLLHRERAADLLARAASAQSKAEALQAHAASTSAVRVEAKRQAAASGTEADRAKAARAIAKEEIAWKNAREAWSATAGILAEAQRALDNPTNAESRSIRLQCARARIGSGNVIAAATDLEQLLRELEQEGAAETKFAEQARAEIGSAYYMGARSMRLSGRPDETWRLVSALARQQFRYLAERPVGELEDAAVREKYQRNLEIVLNLEQCPLDELEATPTPYPPCKNCRFDIGLIKRKRGPNVGDSGLGGEIENAKGW